MVQHRSVWAGLLAVICCCIRASLAYDDLNEVPYTYSDEQDRLYVQTLTGRRWHVHHSVEYNKVFFANIESGETMWEDPRMIPLTDAERASLSPDLLARYDNESLLTNMSDEELAAAGLERVNLDSTTVTMVALVPLVLLTGAMVGRIWYLHMYHPQLLFPTKERKERIRGGHKFKPQKARGKLNQDNKGGRSNNV